MVTSAYATSAPGRVSTLEALEPRLLLAGNLVISEFMAVNNSTLNDQDGDKSDWIELRNVGASDVNLQNWALTDDAGQPHKWEFPAVTLPVGQYLVVFASGKDRAVAGQQLHTNFKLSSSGEYLALDRPDGTVEHEYTPEYPPQAADVSYGIVDAKSDDTLLDSEYDARVTVPADGALGASWQAEGFDDSAWTAGVTGIGFDNDVIYQPAGSMTLVEAGAAAQVLVPTSDIGTTWRNLSYTPTGWTSGTTGIGYDTGTDYDSMIHLDLQSVMYNIPQRTSAYIRIPFTVADRSLLTSLTLQMKIDDGFVAYINGVKAAEANAPATPLWNSVATTQPAEPTPTGPYLVYDITSRLGDLVNGNNVLAIQGLNRSYSSSDFLILPRLVADYSVPTTAYANYINTDVSAQMSGHNASAYVRIPFYVDEGMNYDKLLLQMQYDDGFVAWIDGGKVASRNAPSSVQWDSAATAANPDASAVVYETIDISSSANLLHPGTNVLVVQGLNLSAADSDFLISAKLIASSSSELSSLQRYFRVPTPGAANGTGTLDLGPIISDVTDSPHEPTDNQNVVVTAKVLPELAPVTSVTMKYLVMFGSEVTLTMYDDGAHGDGSAGDGVYGATIPASASTPGQMVRYYISATDSAHASRWPLYTDAANSEQYEGFVVQDASYSTLLPVFHFFVPSATAADTRSGTRGAVYYLGELYDNVFIRERGGTINAGMAEGAGQSRKIDFNDDHRFLFDPDLPRVTEININDPGPQDATYLRQELSFWLYDQAGMPGEMTFLMHVRQNSSYMGVRIFHEQMDKDALRREGLDEDGALYYTSHTLLTTSDYASFEVKNPKPNTTYPNDLHDLAYGIDPGNANRHLYTMDNLNLPALVNYLAVEALIQDGDCTTHNWYVYRDPDTGEWMYIGHDRDLTWANWVDAGADWTSVTTWGESSSNGDRYWMPPFFAASEFPHADVNGRGWVRLTDAIHDDPIAHEMFYRRLRTLMDEFLKPPGTPYAQLPIEAEIDYWLAQLAYERANNLLPAQDTSKSFAAEITKLKDYYIAGRRNYLYGAKGPYMKYIIQLPARPLWTTADPGDRAVPAAQPAAFAGQITIGAVDYNPVSGNQDQEYIQLTNPNSYAVDISGWQLTNAVDFVFAPGTVLVAGGSLYVTPDAAAFRARTTGPRGNQGLFVQGGYKGHLAGDGDLIRLLDAANNQIAAKAIGATSVVINEVLSHSDAPEGDWVELYNPTASPISIGGWYLSDDAAALQKWRIPDGTTVGAGQYVVFNQRDHFGSALAFSKYGDEAYLSSGGTIVDSRDFGGCSTGVSFGRYFTTDGSVDFVQMSAATSGAANAYPLVGSVVINELMYHPADSGDEYIELYNTTGSAVPLYDPIQPSHTWTISGGVDYTFPAGLDIPAQGYIVVTGTDISAPADEAAFRARNGIPAGVTVLGSFIGQLNNAGEIVRLNRPGTTDPLTGEFAYIHADRVEYNDTLPWPTAADGSGPSLERIDPTRYGNESGNWLALRTGGSAGRRNVLPGDTDFDDDVDFGDYQILEVNFGTTTGGTWAMGDFNFDKQVNFTDYQLMEANFGAVWGGGEGLVLGGSGELGLSITSNAVVAMLPADDADSTAAAPTPSAQPGSTNPGYRMDQAGKDAFAPLSPAEQAPDVFTDGSVLAQVPAVAHIQRHGRNHPEASSLHGQRVHRIARPSGDSQDLQPNLWTLVGRLSGE